MCVCVCVGVFLYLLPTQYQHLNSIKLRTFLAGPHKCKGLIEGKNMVLRCGWELDVG